MYDDVINKFVHFANDMRLVTTPHLAEHMVGLINTAVHYNADVAPTS